MCQWLKGLEVNSTCHGREVLAHTIDHGETIVKAAF